MADELTRRQTLVGLAAMSAVGLTGCGEPRTGDPAVDDPECRWRTGTQTAGPFYPGEPETRMDLREDRDGVQLDLDLFVVAQGSCDPIVGAEVDVWSADASGAYSGYDDFDTEGQSWLRGQQTTDDVGNVQFTLVVPGAYPGRSVHLHVKVRAPGFEELTTQVYLPDEVVERVLERSEYEGSSRQVRLSRDGFYRADTLLTITSDEEDLVAAEGRLVLAV